METVSSDRAWVLIKLGFANATKHAVDNLTIWSNYDNRARPRAHGGVPHKYFYRYLGSCLGPFFTLSDVFRAARFRSLIAVQRVRARIVLTR